MSNTAYIGFGSNLGDSLATLESVKKEINHCPGLSLKRVSPVYRSKPVDAPGGQNDYINAVFELSTSLEPEALLMELGAVENNHGRVRGEVRNSSRTLDLDLLLVDKLVVNSNSLTLPHPRISQRAFVLFPLYDLCPDLEIPGQGIVRLLIEDVRDQELTRL
ncbi:MAG: 2-amino-4-hydroxy-6-hydroxymethyldihydropteridine diphosphokinase [Gammaproteobacteria bacterium]|nr:2-amino-4-hydroxy-6-hydroxymethyldihydropteridine diphosphokinase [Gammaproteobacteria bacterium]